MDDPPALRDPGDTGEPIPHDLPEQPNPHDANDVSVPVMTMAVRSSIGVARDSDANVAVRAGAATADFDDLFRAHYDRLVRA